MMQKKKSIKKNDIILVYYENRPAFFARVENIYPDIKPGWWRIKLLILQIPVIVATWILDNDQIQGAEFTMNGIPMRIEKIEIPQKTTVNLEKKNADQSQSKNQKARILSLNSKNDNVD